MESSFQDIIFKIHLKYLHCFLFNITVSEKTSNFTPNRSIFYNLLCTPSHVVVIQRCPSTMDGSGLKSVELTNLQFINGKVITSSQERT